MQRTARWSYGGRAGPGQVQAGWGAVSIDRAAAHRFRVPLSADSRARFCHSSPVARCQTVLMALWRVIEVRDNNLIAVIKRLSNDTS